MAETPEHAPDHKRATWVALRTLRQRPKVVDHQKNGEPVFEVRSVRLVLRDNADHFNRLAQCSKCGREVPGAPVLTQADLSRPSHSVVCKECVRNATVGSSWTGPPRRKDEAPPAPDALEPVEVDAEVVVESLVEGLDNGRVSAVESQLDLVLFRLAELSDALQSESSERSQADAVVQSDLRAALAQGLEKARAMPPVDADPSAVKALEDRVERSFASVVDLVQNQRRELTAMAAEVVQTRSELAESNRERASVSDEVERRLVELTASIAAQPTAGALLEEFRAELKEAENRLIGSVNAQRDRLHLTLTEGLAQARLEVGSLEQQVHKNAAALTHLVETERDERATVRGETGQEVATILGSVQELAEAQERLDRRLDGLLQNAVETEDRVNALVSTAGESASRLRALETITRISIDRLTAVIDSERRMRQGQETRGALALQRQLDDAAANAGPGSLLGDLDHQLQQAERRLAGWVTPSDPE